MTAVVQPEASLGQPAPLVTVRNTFLCDISPKTGLPRRCVSAEPPAVCDRYEVQMHTLMFRKANAYPPKVLKVDGGTLALGAEPASIPSNDVSSQESTASDIDGDDSSDVSQRTASSENTPKTRSTGLRNSEQQDEAAGEPDRMDALIKSEGMESLIKRVPRDESGNATSVGSILHEEGTCKPCVFAHSERKECQNGVQCVFCHFAHPPKRRLRFCKKRRMEMKRLADQEQD